MDIFSHTTHLLQVLSVEVFLFLANICQKILEEITHFTSESSVNKIDFLELYQKTEEEDETVKNIKHFFLNI